MAHVSDGETDLYGKYYYLRHLPEKYGYPDIETRARHDLPERCLYWLRTLLKYKPPPSKILELGCAHGGFVSLLQWAGYEATGLELSPWLANYASGIFGVTVLAGPIEDQQIAPASLDVIVLMDVLEHLQNPVATVSHCLGLLKPDGIFLIQTPSFPENKSYEQLQNESSPFLEQLKYDEHLHLFSKSSITEFFSRIGFDSVRFEPAIFSHYDMFFLSGRTAVTVHPQEEIVTALTVSPSGRLMQALIDIDDEKRNWIRKYAEAEADRAARLAVIHKLEQQLAEAEADRTAKLAAIHKLERQHLTAQKRFRQISQELHGIVAERDKELEIVKTSFSWRITSLLRWVLGKISSTEKP
ncbi:MAG: class I SAM-dependent methyltransferase [Nitrospiraceae bacterium]|nr:class I SAM-dependent methyltransferase [Nitrospiraceae bacterium]